MADAQHFDLYWSRLLTRAADELAKPRGSRHRPLRELTMAGVEVVGWLAAVAIPSFSATSNTCKGERLKRDDVIAWCRKLAVALDNSDTYIAQMIGRAIATRVWTPESPEFVRFVKRNREYSYIRKTIEPYFDMVQGSDEDTRRWLNRFRANRSEHDAFRAWLTELGIPPDPPADWVPEEPDALLPGDGRTDAGGARVLRPERLSSFAGAARSHGSRAQRPLDGAPAARVG